MATGISTDNWDPRTRLQVPANVDLCVIGDPNGNGRNSWVGVNALPPGGLEWTTLTEESVIVWNN